MNTKYEISKLIEDAKSSLQDNFSQYEQSLSDNFADFKKKVFEKIG
ncbi:MAG: hypothetical protein R1F52_02700 [Candidatus Nitrosoabyssus spongiisocia]|nr:MAG: hypothetical protein R1F52_02700 [Nitrosopumilaceae archaeon AB1(1)]